MTEARTGKLDPVIGRDAEIRRVIQIQQYDELMKGSARYCLVCKTSTKNYTMRPKSSARMCGRNFGM